MVVHIDPSLSHQAQQKGITPTERFSTQSKQTLIRPFQGRPSLSSPYTELLLQVSTSLSQKARASSVLVTPGAGTKLRPLKRKQTDNSKGSTLEQFKGRDSRMLWVRIGTVFPCAVCFIWVPLGPESQARSQRPQNSPGHSSPPHL